MENDVDPIRSSKNTAIQWWNQKVLILRKLEEDIRLKQAKESTPYSVRYLIDFTTEVAWDDISGFDPRSVWYKEYVSDYTVKIIDIHRIDLCCDCIFRSTGNGWPSNVPLIIILNEAPGNRIVRNTNLVMYKHRYGTMDLRCEDDDGNRDDHHGHSVALRLHLENF